MQTRKEPRDGGPKQFRTRNSTTVRAEPPDFEQTTSRRQAPSLHDCIARLQDCMTAAGMPYSGKDSLKTDGTVNRWDENGRRNGPLWCFVHELSSGHVAAAFGDWRTASSHHFRSWENGHAVDPNEAQRLLDELERRRKLAEEQEAKSKGQAAKRVQEQWSYLPETGSSAYLERKQVQAFGIRYGADYHGNFIAVPMRDISGTLRAFQRIYDDGVKRFPKGSEKKGCYHLIGELNPTGELCLAEGYATAVTVHQATGKPVAVCFDAGNLKAVADALKSVYPDLRLILAADNDQWKAGETGPDGKPKGNTGIKAAYAVAHAHPGTRIAIPSFENLDTSGKPTDFNDLARLAGLEHVSRQLERAKEPRKGNGKDTDTSAQARTAEADIPPIQFKLTSKNTPKALVFNALQVFRHDPRWKGVFGYDEFAECVMLLKRPPYDRGTQEWPPRPVADSDDIETASWMQGEFDLPISSAIAAEAIQVTARRNRYHPIKDYLDPLKWDGTPRLDNWLINYFGAADSEYTRAVSAKSLISAVARIYRPGCKVDTVLILDGPQGYLKSTAWRILAGDEWFTDYMPDLHSKDAMQQLSGKWIVEFAELSAMARSEVEATKRFISSPQDNFRPAYGRRCVTLKRQCIFVGTTNETCYLKDSTGNRRFWPVTITKRCDIAALKDERNQFWAEAVHRFHQGERWHLTGKIEQQAAEEQRTRIEPDEWEAPIMAYLEKRPDIMFITSGEILETVLGIDIKDWLTVSQKRVASILKSHGWKHFGKRIDGVKTKGFLRPFPKPPEQPDPPPTDSEGGTDGAGTNNCGTGTGSTNTAENRNETSNLQGRTVGTDGTGTYITTQQIATVNDDSGGSSSSNCDNANVLPRFIETPCSTVTTGSTLQAADTIQVLGAIPGTGTALEPVPPTGTGSNTGSIDNPPDFGASDDGYWMGATPAKPQATPPPPDLCATPGPIVPTASSAGVAVAGPTAVTEPRSRNGHADCRACKYFNADKFTCAHFFSRQDPARPACQGKRFDLKGGRQ